MNHSQHDPIPESTPAEQPAPTDGLASASRRRGLLRGLSAGAAISGAALPMAALATGGRKSCFHKDTPHRKCKASVSGMHSVIASNQVNDWPESPGKHCSHYQSRYNWPKDGGGEYCKGVNGTKFRRNAQYKQVFNCGGGGYNDKTIGEIMDNQYNCPQRHWIAACLNATKYEYSSVPFSYTPHQVVSLHNDASRNLDAQTFFRYYQENYY
ncbi:MAG: hypothetical protein H6932_11375 [Burkholderiaceae bacterium]|nr:hypothetical protein [Rhodoferax sp.]MCP5271820.1 hypothetical protein [Burkholderiaceae bacterium]